MGNDEDDICPECEESQLRCACTKSGGNQDAIRRLASQAREALKEPSNQKSAEE